MRAGNGGAVIGRETVYGTLWRHSLLRVLWHWGDRFDSAAEQPFVPLGDDDEADGRGECEDRDCLTDLQARGGKRADGDGRD